MRELEEKTNQKRPWKQAHAFAVLHELNPARILEKAPEGRAMNWEQIWWDLWLCDDIWYYLILEPLKSWCENCWLLRLAPRRSSQSHRGCWPRKPVERGVVTKQIQEIISVWRERRANNMYILYIMYTYILWHIHIPSIPLFFIYTITGASTSQHRFLSGFSPMILVCLQEDCQAFLAKGKYAISSERLT